jgi:hypothetical protein
MQQSVRCLAELVAGYIVGWLVLLMDEWLSCWLFDLFDWPFG